MTTPVPEVRRDGDSVVQDYGYFANDGLRETMDRIEVAMEPGHEIRYARVEVTTNEGAMYRAGDRHRRRPREVRPRHLQAARHAPRRPACSPTRSSEFTCGARHGWVPRKSSSTSEGCLPETASACHS